LTAAVRPWLGLQATLMTQVMATMSLSMAPVLAPAIAPLLGLAPERVGIFTGLAYGLAMIAGLGSGAWVARNGATRTMQIVLACMAAGGLVMALGQAALLPLAAVLMGLGYGSANPASADILGRHVPQRSAGLFFALKQTGVPIGVGLAGVLLPWGLMAFGWQAAVMGVAVACLLLALLLQPAISRLDGGAVRAQRARGGWMDGVLMVMRRRVLRDLSFVSLAYALTQHGFLTFVVALLHLERGLPLALAAGMLSASQLVCVFMRVGMGHVADRWVSPRLLLGTLGLAMSASCVLLALLPQNANIALIAVAVIATGATSMGWNGVFFAQLARSVPREELAASTGATQFFTFGGSLLGPVLFGAWLMAGASHSSGYLLMACVAMAGAVLILKSQAPASEART
jgi:MFS family permease